MKGEREKESLFLPMGSLALSSTPLRAGSFNEGSLANAKFVRGETDVSWFSHFKLFSTAFPHLRNTSAMFFPFFLNC